MIRKLQSILLAAFLLLVTAAYTPPAYSCLPQHQSWCQVEHFCTLIPPDDFDGAVYPPQTVVLYHLTSDGWGYYTDYYWVPNADGCQPSLPTPYPQYWGLAVTAADGSGRLEIII